MYGFDFDDTARPMVIGILGITPCCRKCAAELSDRSRISFLGGKRVKCPACDWYGNWRFGTMLEGSRLNNTQFLALFFRYTIPADAPAIAKHLNIDPGTVREWREKLVSAVRSATTNA